MLSETLKMKKKFPHKLLLTTTHVTRLCKASANNSLPNIKLSKTQFHKIVQPGGFLGRLLGPLLKTGLPLIGNVLKTLIKSVLIPLGVTAVASGTDTAIHKKMFRSGFATLKIPNEEMNDIMKINKSVEKYGLLIKGVSETIKDFLECY